MLTQWFNTFFKKNYQRVEQSCFENFGDMYGNLLRTNTDLREQIQEQQKAINNLAALITIHSKKDISLGLTQEGLPYFLAAEVSESRIAIRVYNYKESLQWKSTISITLPKGNGVCSVDELEYGGGFRQVASEKLSELLTARGIILEQTDKQSNDLHNRFFLTQK